MLDILFSHSYYYPLDKKQWENKTPYPPLGTIYAASLMRENNFSISLFDTNLRNNPFDIEKEIQEKKPSFLVIYDDGFNYLTKMCLTNMREAAFEMITIGKKYNCTVIVNSSDSTDHYKKYLGKPVFPRFWDSQQWFFPNCLDFPSTLVKFTKSPYTKGEF